MGNVLAVNISQERGTDKYNVYEVNVVVGWGVEDDAHGGDWDRQVSVFPIEAMEKVPPHKNEEVLRGGDTENFTISGIPLEELTVGAVLRLGDAEIKILCVGKKEFKEKGRPYIVSREGRFGRVIKGGKVKVGDQAVIV